MVTAVMGGGLYFRPGDGEDYARLFRVKNRAYDTALRLRERGKRVPLPSRWVEAASRLPDDHAWAGGVILPRMVRPAGLRLVDRRAIPDRAIDVAQRSTYVLRTYQAAAVESAIKNETALLVAPTGSGKTTIGVSIISRVKTRALVLVHTHDLARQWVERMAEQLEGGFTVGVVGDGSDERDADVVVATVQTLTRWSWNELYEFGKGFGLTLLDEAHHAPAETFGFVLSALPSRYRVGLTATPERDDGLTELLHWHFGKPAWSVSLRELADSGDVLLPEFEWLTYRGPEPDYEGVPDWADLVDSLCSDEGRNEALLLVVRLEVLSGRQVLVLTGRVEHAEEFASRLCEAGLTAEPLHGKSKNRGDIIERARRRETQVLVGTSVADEGLDIKTLETLVLACPTRSLGRLAQRIGRIMRPAPGKRKPKVIDVLDERHGVLCAQAAQRRRFFERTYS